MTVNGVCRLGLVILLSGAVQAAPFDADRDERTIASLDGIVARDDGIPPLLGMAASQPPEEPARTVIAARPERVQSERLARQVQVQKKRIAELSRTIATLNERQAQATTSPEVVAQLQRERDAGREKLAALEKQDAQTQAALEKEKMARTALEKEVEQVRDALSGNARQLAEMQQTQASDRKAQAVALKQKDAVIREKELALSEVKASLEKARAPAIRQKPEGSAAVRDYAIGTSLAKDMTSLLDERAVEGVKVDRRWVLAGVQDMFSGDVQVSGDVLEKALHASEQDVVKAQEQRKVQTLKSGRAYMADFARRKGVKKHPDGFLYQVDYAGKGSIADTDTVTTVLKESLTDGTVINDMDASGALVSQPLNAYPALFQSAIRLLKMHGSMTLVVPPELAYGDQGYPPQVPPGATIVYTLRIHDVVKAQKVAP